MPDISGEQVIVKPPLQNSFARNRRASDNSRPPSTNKKLGISLHEGLLDLFSKWIF